MFSFMMILTTAAGIAGAVALFLLAILALRNPHNPEWMFGESFSQLAALLLTVGIVSALSVAVQEFYSNGMTVTMALIITSVIILVSGVAFYILFGMGERMRRANDGHSTFERVGHGAVIPGKALTH